MFSLRKKKEGEGEGRKEKKKKEYKFHARQLAKVRRCNAHAIRTHIDLLSLRSRIRAERSLKSILTWARVVHTRKRVYPRASFPLFHARMCVEQFTPTRSAAANSVYFHSLFLFRALLKTVERCLEIRGALYRARLEYTLVQKILGRILAQIWTVWRDFSLRLEERGVFEISMFRDREEGDLKF